MCNCYDEMQAKLKSHYAVEAPPEHTDLEVDLGGYRFTIDDKGLGHVASFDATVRYLAPRKSGGMKKAVHKTFLVATFCPFCGERYKPKVETPAAAQQQSTCSHCGNSPCDGSDVGNCV